MTPKTIVTAWLNQWHGQTVTNARMFNPMVEKIEKYGGKKYQEGYTQGKKEAAIELKKQLDKYINECSR